MDDKKAVSNKDAHGHKVNSEQPEPMDVSLLMFAERDGSSMVNESMESCEHSINGVWYSPFASGSNEEELDSSVEENTTLSRIGPFSDNRPICGCATIQRMMETADARYLLSLLPDMAECNFKQKSVFKTRVVTKLQNILMSKV